MRKSILSRFLISNILWVLFTTCLIAALGLTRTFGTAYINDITLQIEGRVFDRIGFYIFMAVFLQLWFYFIRWAIGVICWYLSEKLAYELRVKIISHLNKIPFIKYESLSVGDIQSLVRNDTTAASNFIYAVLYKMIGNASIFVAAGWYMATIDVGGTIAVIVLSLFLGVVNHFINKRIRAYELESRNLLGQISSIAIKCLEMFDTIKLYVSSGFMLNKFAKSRDTYNDAIMGSVRLKAKSTVIMGITQHALLLGTCILLGHRAIQRQDVSIGEMLVFIALLNQVQIAVTTAFNYMSDLMSSYAAFDRIEEKLSIPVEDDTGVTVWDITKLDFENVSFSYNSEKKIIDNMHLSLEKGKLYKIAGESGSGKSTLLKILLGLYKSDVMDIVINGERVDNLRLQDVSTFVPSNPELFNMSILENLQMGEVAVSLERCRTLAEELGILAWIEALEDGFGYIISNSAGNLSGGQKQLIAIARAILHDSQIIVLDEPFSALDEGMEKRLVNVLKKCRDRIIIFTSHRDSVIFEDDIFGVYTLATANH